MATSTKIELFTYCGACDEVFHAHEEVEEGVCPKCGEKDHMDAPCEWRMLWECQGKYDLLDTFSEEEFSRQVDQMPEVAG